MSERKCEFCGHSTDANVRRCCAAGLAVDQQKAAVEPQGLTYRPQDVAGLVVADAIKRGLVEPFKVRFDVGENTFKVVVVEDRAVPEAEAATPLVKLS